MANLVMVPPITRSVRQVEFRLDGKRVSQAKWVALTGSFNLWDTAAHRMVRGSDGAWTIVDTCPGRVSVPVHRGRRALERSSRRPPDPM